MIVGFDPVAGEVCAHEEGRKPVCAAPADVVTVKFFTETGILYFEMRGQVAELFYFGPEGLPGTVALAPAGEGHWMVITGAKP